MSKVPRKLKRGSQPESLLRRDIPEGVPVEYSLGDTEVGRNREGIDAMATEVESDANLTDPDTFVIPELLKLKENEDYEEKAPASSTSVVKEGTMLESPQQEPSRSQKTPTVTPRNLVQIMEHELQQKANSVGSPISTTHPGKVSLIKDRLLKRLPQAGTSSVRNEASIQSYNAEPVGIIKEIITP